MNAETRESKVLDLLLNTPSREILRQPLVDAGLAEVEPFPFLAIVGQEEMKLALLLSIINPLVGGVLLIGPRGTAKTTAVRALGDLLPRVQRSLCPEGCTEEMAETGGMDTICKECATKFGYGEPLTSEDRVRLVELPLNARLEDVVGGIDERLALEQQRVRLQRGLLAQADGNLLYIDEVNLLDDAITDAILDAAAQGFYTVRRGPMKLAYRSRFILIGSMNPEEGRLRPQIMDRFGLRALVTGLDEPAARYEAYQRARRYYEQPNSLAAAYAELTLLMAEQVQAARERLPAVTVGDDARALGLAVVQELGIASNRAEITLFEAARARAAAEERDVATADDVRSVASFSLRQRQSTALADFVAQQEAEDERLRRALDAFPG